jgi:hypothetical protein
VAVGGALSALEADLGLLGRLGLLLGLALVAAGLLLVLLRRGAVLARLRGDLAGA